jgi:4-oxalmesaconate hydratase
MVGAVKGIDPETGNYFDDTRRYIDNSTILNAADKKKIFESNAMKVYPRLSKQMQKQGIGVSS